MFKIYDWSAGEAETCHFTWLRSSGDILDENIIQDDKRRLSYGQ